MGTKYFMHVVIRSSELSEVEQFTISPWSGKSIRGPKSRETENPPFLSSLMRTIHEESLHDYPLDVYQTKLPTQFIPGIAANWIERRPFHYMRKVLLSSRHNMKAAKAPPNPAILQVEYHIQLMIVGIASANSILYAADNSLPSFSWVISTPRLLWRRKE